MTHRHHKHPYQSRKLPRDSPAITQPYTIRFQWEYIFDLVLFQNSEELISGVVGNAMLEVEKLLDTVLLVLSVFVVVGLLCLGHSLNTLVKVVLGIVAGTLHSSCVSMFLVFVRY